MHHCGEAILEKRLEECLGAYCLRCADLNERGCCIEMRSNRRLPCDFRLSFEIRNPRLHIRGFWETGSLFCFCIAFERGRINSGS